MAAAASPFSEYALAIDSQRKPLDSQYTILGFISSGTYGKVYKARRFDSDLEFAIKKFKPEKESDQVSGISQSAFREIALCRALSNLNVVHLEQVDLDPKERSIAMVFEFAEHDLLVLAFDAANSAFP